MKNPIDLSTIKRKLDTSQYQEPWQYVDDVWLMFNNAWLYNRKTSRVYKYCSKLAEVFESEIDPVMQSLGYCCGRKVRYRQTEGFSDLYFVHLALHVQLSCYRSRILKMTFYDLLNDFTDISPSVSLQYEFSPQTLCCYGKQLCTIPTGGTYYSYQNR